MMRRFLATKVVLFFVLEKNWLEKGPPPETKLMLLGMVGGKVSKSFALFFTMMIWMDGRTDGQTDGGSP